MIHTQSDNSSHAAPRIVGEEAPQIVGEDAPQIVGGECR
jgi:hypothetical protein